MSIKWYKTGTKQNFKATHTAYYCLAQTLMSLQNCYFFSLLAHKSPTKPKNVNWCLIIHGRTHSILGVCVGVYLLFTQFTVWCSYFSVSFFSILPFRILLYLLRLFFSSVCCCCLFSVAIVLSWLRDEFIKNRHCSCSRCCCRFTSATIYTINTHTQRFGSYTAPCAKPQPKEPQYWIDWRGTQWTYTNTNVAQIHVQKSHTPHNTMCI